MKRHGVESRTLNLNLMGVVYFAMFFISFLINSIRPIFYFPKMGLEFWHTMLVDSVYGIVLGAIVSLISFVLLKSFSILQDLSKEFSQLLGPLDVKSIFFLSWFSSVGEEFFFRGLLQHYVGLVPAALLFGLMHIGPNKKYLSWTIFAIVMGVLLGAIYDWRRNLILPVMVHFTVNFINLCTMSTQAHGAENS
ncbi:MAG: CPBP family intramembrane metalloprotease [Bdellovibrionales bacterium]|nr:CPBP family intramembrane metalloprotease [Bdellovibrionales bacterium]